MKTVLDEEREDCIMLEIIVNGDPIKDIRLLMDADKNIDLIMKDGEIYRNAAQ